MFTLSSFYLPRDLHPAAWWLWALGMASAASSTTNPWLLGVIIAVVCFVVLARRGDAPWAASFRLYLWLGAFIVFMRCLFRVVFGGAEGPTVLVTLPAIPLPEWAAGIELLGKVSAEGLLSGFYDGLRLATMVICLGAANALANPKRLLRSLPAALYEVGTAVVVALSVFPQLAESVQRVNRARRLRGSSGAGRRALKVVIVPVLEDALNRSLQLAASMDSRGYGRTGEASARSRRLTGLFLVSGLVGLCVGVYATLDATTPRYLAGPMLLTGLALATAGFVFAGRRVHRSRYRPDRWQPAEVITAGSGVAVAALMLTAPGVEPSALNPSFITVAWPLLAWPPLLVLLLGLLPAWLTPPPAASNHTHAPLTTAADENPSTRVTDATEPAAHRRFSGIRPVGQGER